MADERREVDDYSESSEPVDLKKKLTNPVFIVVAIAVLMVAGMWLRAVFQSSGLGELGSAKGYDITFDDLDKQNRETNKSLEAQQKAIDELYQQSEEFMSRKPLVDLQGKISQAKFDTLATLWRIEREEMRDMIKDQNEIIKKLQANQGRRSSRSSDSKSMRRQTNSSGEIDYSQVVTGSPTLSLNREDRVSEGQPKVQTGWVNLSFQDEVMVTNGSEVVLNVENDFYLEGELILANRATAEANVKRLSRDRIYMEFTKLNVGGDVVYNVKNSAYDGQHAPGIGADIKDGRSWVRVLGSEVANNIDVLLPTRSGLASSYVYDELRQSTDLWAHLDITTQVTTRFSLDKH